MVLRLEQNSESFILLPPFNEGSGFLTIGLLYNLCSLNLRRLCNFEAFLNAQLLLTDDGLLLLFLFAILVQWLGESIDCYVSQFIRVQRSAV